MTTNSEAPVSISTTAYYKGFSMIITKRDPDVKHDRLLEEQVKMIDFLIDNGFKPSWNEDTNKAQLGTTEKVDPCPKCGSALVNMVTKTGRKAVKCSTNKWNVQTKQAEGCDYIKWEQMTEEDL